MNPVDSLGPTLKTVSGELVFAAGVLQLVAGQDAIRQAAECRLRTFREEWFLDTSVGTPYSTEILGNNTQPLYDQALKSVILGTEGVSSIDSYTSTYDSATRSLTVEATITTIYGSTALTTTLPF